MKDNLPDKDGFFGEYGGKFVPETLMYALNELEQTYKTLKDNNDFNAEFHKDLAEFVGRPSPLYLSLIHISEPTRLLSSSYAGFCL